MPSRTRTRTRSRSARARALVQFVDRAEAAARNEAVPPEVAEAKLARDGREEEEGVAPGGVDLGPLDLQREGKETWVSASSGC